MEKDTCFNCQVHTYTFKCECETPFCPFCGLEQGEFKNKRFEKCRNCKTKLQTTKTKPTKIEIDIDDVPKGWEEFFETNIGLLKQINKKIDFSREIYPPLKDVFNAFRYCSPNKIKVVLLGQDCYHGEGQAMGLSFSVRKGISPPPSLRNIFIELESDGFTIQDKSNGDLTKWAKQGVFLCNKALTVEKSSPGSHLDIWKDFTDQTIKYINYNCENIVFILWGNFAKKCGSMIRGDHKIIESAHPSPFSAHNGFFGSKPFSQANRYLKSVGKKPIDWNL